MLVESAENSSVFMGLLWENLLTQSSNDGKGNTKINPGTETWTSNLTKENLSWTHNGEMGRSDVIKQGQWRAIYFWNRMDSCLRFTNGLLTRTRREGGCWGSCTVRVMCFYCSCCRVRGQIIRICNFQKKKKKVGIWFTAVYMYTLYYKKILHLLWQKHSIQNIVFGLRT